MHVLLCVENSYFKNKDNYISQAEWVKLWQKALKVNCGTAEKRLVRDNPYQLPKKKWVYKATWAKRY